MFEYIIRPAKKEDFPGIRALINAVRINPTGLVWRRFLVATSKDGRLVGCGQIKLHADGSKELASIAVQPQFRGQGVARAIIENLLQREPFRPLFLMCRAQLEPLYTKFGFQSVFFDDLPPYFKRIKRLEEIFNKMAKSGDRLIIMRSD